MVDDSRARGGYPERVRKVRDPVWRRPHRGASVAVALVVVALGAVGGSLEAQATAAQEAPEPAQPEPQTSAPPTTVADSTSSTILDVMPPSGAGAEQHEPLTASERATRNLRWITGGLLGLAVAVVLATVVFWRRTSPARLMAQEAAEVGFRGASKPAEVSSWSTVPSDGMPVGGRAVVGTGDVVPAPGWESPPVVSEIPGAPPVSVPLPAAGAAGWFDLEPAVQARQDLRSPVAVPAHGLWASSGWDDSAGPVDGPAPEVSNGSDDPEPLAEEPPPGWFGRAEQEAPNPFHPRS